MVRRDAPLRGGNGVIVAIWSRIELSQLPVERAVVLLVQGPGRLV
jgi:hypothetical protein